MTFSKYAAAAFVALYAPTTYASIRAAADASFPFPDDKVNATTEVKFNNYDVTEPFSNSSTPNITWLAQVKVRGPVQVGEKNKDYDPEKDDSFSVSVSEISLSYDFEGSRNDKKPDDSWGACVHTQTLFNVSINATSGVDSTCKGVLEPECIDWLQAYVDRGGLCRESEDEGYIYESIAKGPCSLQNFPYPTEGPIEDEDLEVPDWGTMHNVTLDDMRVQYVSNGAGSDIDEYDALLPKVYVLLASFGQRKDNDTTAAAKDSVLNGTVLCLKADQVADGSRDGADIEGDANTISGGRVLTIAAVAVSTALMAFVF